MLRLPYHPPLAREALLGYLAARAIPGVEAVAGSTYRRSTRVAGGTRVVELEVLDGASVALVRAVGASRQPTAVQRTTERARALLDLDVDPAVVGDALGRDPLLRPLVARLPGLRVAGCWDGFELAVRAILGQQVSVRAANTLAGRLVSVHGEPLAEPVGSITHAFPAPAALTRLAGSSIGVPETRAGAIRALACAVGAGRIALGPGVPIEETTAALELLPGVGRWTAQYVAMRALRDPDAFPASDLGLRRALGVEGVPATAAAATRLAEAWRPWRAYAAVHLWTATGAGPRQGR